MNEMTDTLPTSAGPSPAPLSSAPEVPMWPEVGAVYRIACHQGFRVWKCVGEFLGGEGSEDMIGLMALDRKCGYAHGKNCDVMLMPRLLFLAARPQKC